MKVYEFDILCELILGIDITNVYFFLLTPNWT